MLFLLEHDPAVNVRNSRGRTPMHYVKNAWTARALVNAGADASLRDKDGKTPLDLTKDKDIANTLKNAVYRED